MAEMEINEEQYQELLRLNGGELDMGVALKPAAAAYLAQLASEYEARKESDNAT